MLAKISIIYKNKAKNGFLFATTIIIVTKKVVIWRNGGHQSQLADYSHGGNVLFPGWECDVPKVEINSSQ